MGRLVYSLSFIVEIKIHLSHPRSVNSFTRSSLRVLSQALKDCITSLKLQINNINLDSQSRLIFPWVTTLLRLLD